MHAPTFPFDKTHAREWDAYLASHALWPGEPNDKWHDDDDTRADFAQRGCLHCQDGDDTGHYRHTADESCGDCVDEAQTAAEARTWDAYADVNGGDDFTYGYGEAGPYQY